MDTADTRREVSGSAVSLPAMTFRGRLKKTLFLAIVALAIGSACSVSLAEAQGRVDIYNGMAGNSQPKEIRLTAKATVGRTARRIVKIRARGNVQTAFDLGRQLSKEPQRLVGPVLAFVGNDPITDGIDTIRSSGATPGTIFLIFHGHFKRRHPELTHLPRNVAVASVNNQGTVWCADQIDPSPARC